MVTVNLFYMPFAVCTVSQGPRFFVLKKRVTVTCSTDREEEVSKVIIISLLYVCLTRSGNAFYSRETRFHSENASEFFPSTLRRNFTGHFGFVLEKNSVREITWLSQGNNMVIATLSFS